MGTSYYSEWDDGAAAWIEALIDKRVLTDGPVDRRDIEDVLPSDLKGFERVHLFAGIGTWDYALTYAGWPADREVWTVSAPCQPFSAAGQRKGTADKRHLWPAVDWLVGQRRPHTVLGEQVASKDGRAWFDHVQADLEARGYAVGAAVTPAAGYGAPHERHRNYFVAVDGLAGASSTRLEGHGGHGDGRGKPRRVGEITGGPVATDSLVGGLADNQCVKCSGITDAGRGYDGDRQTAGWVEGDGRAQSGGAVGRLAVDASGGRGVVGSAAQPGRVRHVDCRGDTSCRPGPTNGFWRDADWLGCRDERWRPVEPGTFPLAHGPAARVGRLRGYGNGIVLPQAVAFIQSFLEGEAEFLSLRDF